MKKLKLTFPTVLDPSLNISRTALEEFHANAVPTTYVIDRDGKVAAAWVGYSEKDDRPVKALKALGFQ
jgi:peroxiredoxin